MVCITLTDNITFLNGITVKLQALYSPFLSLMQVAQSYMADYDYLDVVRATINGNSSSRWGISPPSKAALISDLMGDQLMNLKFEWNFKR